MAQASISNQNETETKSNNQQVTAKLKCNKAKTHNSNVNDLRNHSTYFKFKKKFINI